jgi:hypothetical protein
VPWYAIRNVFLFEAKAKGPHVFEERVVCFQATSSKEAHAKAEKEAAEYAAGLGMTRHGAQLGYELDDEDAPARDGAEVWSELYDFAGTLEEFYAARYVRYPHDPS